jgi:hypothetical protein
VTGPAAIVATARRPDRRRSAGSRVTRPLRSAIDT